MARTQKRAAATHTEDVGAGHPDAPSRLKGGPSLPSPLASMAYRDFRYLWLSQNTHAFALWMEQTARPLLILSMTGSAVHLGGVIFVRTAPAMVLGMFAGVVADSFNRRTVLLRTKGVVLWLSAVFAWLVVTGQVEVWHIYLFSFLRGSTMAFDQPARRAMIPSVVPKRLVINAMALSSASMGVMRIAGAAAAGLLMGVIGIEAPFVTIAVVYVGAVFFTWMLRVEDHEQQAYRGLRNVPSDLMEGIRFAWNTPAIRGVMIIATGYFTFGMAFMQVFAPLFATQVLSIGESGFGFMIAIMGIGSVIGSLTLATVSPSKRRGALMLGLLLLFGFLLVLFSAASYSTSVVPVFVVVVLVGIGQSGFIPLVNTVLVEAAPPNMRGRIMGLLSLDRAMMAFGGLLAGVLATAVGPQVSQILFGIACILTAGVMFAAYPPLRRVQ